MCTHEHTDSQLDGTEPQPVSNVPWCSPVCSLHCLPNVLPVSLRYLAHNLHRGVHDRSGIGGIGTLLSSTNIHLEGAVDAEGEKEMKSRREKRGEMEGGKGKEGGRMYMWCRRRERRNTLRTWELLLH